MAWLDPFRAMKREPAVAVTALRSDRLEHEADMVARADSLRREPDEAPGPLATMRGRDDEHRVIPLNVSRVGGTGGKEG
jgi:hypothetical protein